MAAPELTFSITGNKISAVSGFDSITVTFSSDIAYTAFECRATKSGEDWGRGKGALIASFSQTPAGTQRTFEVYDDFLLSGDGEYRISLFAQSADERNPKAPENSASRQNHSFLFPKHLTACAMDSADWQL